MSCVEAVQICAKTGSTPTLMARINAEDDSGNDSPIVQGDVLTIVYTVRNLDLIDEDGEPTQTVGGSLTVSNVIFDTLQTGTIWTTDGTGYNFKHTLPAGAINAEARFKVYYTITLSGGAVDVFEFDITGELAYGVDS